MTEAWIRRAAEEIAQYIARHTYSAFGNVAGDWDAEGIAAIIERHAGEREKKDKAISHFTGGSDSFGET